MHDKLRCLLTKALQKIRLQDCLDYIYGVTVVGTCDRFLLGKSVINDSLAKRFPDVEFEESEPELDHAGDIDYLGKVGEKSFGIQIKPITANANFDGLVKSPISPPLVGGDKGEGDISD